MSSSTSLPTSRWREALTTGEDPYFTEPGLDEADDALEQFLRALDDCKTAGEAELAVKALVLRLNDIGGLDGKHGNFIETDEREELGAWISERLTERTFVFDTDITAEWRTW